MAASSTDGLSIAFDTHERVRELIDRLTFYMESISLSFDAWDEDPRRYGPGLYLAVVVGPGYGSFADPMAKDAWPADPPPHPIEDEKPFFEQLTEVAYTCDGAVVLSVDGVVQPQLVRFRSLEEARDVEYASWMGARHMSAQEISTHPAVVSTLTVSQEDGRVTVFAHGKFSTTSRDTFGDGFRNGASLAAGER